MTFPLVWLLNPNLTCTFVARSGFGCCGDVVVCGGDGAGAPSDLSPPVALPPPCTMPNSTHVTPLAFDNILHLRYVASSSQSTRSSNQIMRTAWQRLIRFVATDGRTLYGEPILPSPDFDLGNTTAGTGLKAKSLLARTCLTPPVQPRCPRKLSLSKSSLVPWPKRMSQSSVASV